MPKVPYSDNVVPLVQQDEAPSETMFAMAAALMHQENRLFTEQGSNVDKGKGEPVTQTKL